MLKRSNPTTVKDVALKAGVSPSTVSRVISNNPKISEATRVRVTKVMEELGYYPNAIARSLASRKTGILGVIMPNWKEDLLLNPFFPEALRGIVKAASKCSYDILLSTNTDSRDELQIVKGLIQGSKVDGIVLMSSVAEDAFQAYLSSIDFPFSIIGSPETSMERINHVDNDNYMAAYELTRYLASIGRKRIALIGGEGKLIATRKRIEGYRKALEESNLPFVDELLYTGKFNEETGYTYGETIARLQPMPDAIISTDDLISFGVVKVFKSLKIRIPEDIAIASFNNSVLSRYSDTPLTSVDINAYDLGYEAVHLLTRAIGDNVRGNKVIVPYAIIKRQSTEGHQEG